MSDSQVYNYEYDKLLAGITHRVTETRLDLTDPSADVTYPRGTVMAVSTVTSKLVPFVQGGTDGAGDFYAILAEDTTFTTTTGKDLNVVVYLTGQFNENAITFTGAGTIADIRSDARDKGCFFEIAADNDSTRYIG